MNASILHQKCQPFLFWSFHNLTCLVLCDTVPTERNDKMTETLSYDNTLSIGKHTFRGPVLEQPQAQNVQPSVKQFSKLWEKARVLGELGWAAHILYATECLVGIKMTPKEEKAYHRELAKQFRHYCPNIRQDVTGMELHAAIAQQLGTYKPRFSKRDVQAVFLAYQQWQKLETRSVKQMREKSWIGYGLAMMMASRYYKAAFPEKDPLVKRIYAR